MRSQVTVIDALKQEFQASKDLIVHSFEYYEQQICLIYLQDLCDSDKIKTDIIQPLMLCEKESKFLLHLLSLSSCESIQNKRYLGEYIISGNVLIFISNGIYSYNAIRSMDTQSEEATVETSVQGPQKAFSHDLSTNIALIRKRYPSNKLSVEYQTVGTISKTSIAIIYDVDFADKKVIQELNSRLKRVKIDVIQAVGQLENKLSNKKIHLFPCMMITERPDRTVLNLAQGKVVIIMDGTPFSLSTPTVFFDFITSMDDIYHSFWIKKLLQVIRYLALIITLVLPALYIAITSYNPEILRSQLLLTIAGSRAGVPYPSIYEVLFMMVAVEMLVEASIRLPRVMGPTATTVGGLILGQAAQQAQLVSSIMIIITAFVAISNFTMPISAMSFAIRCIRYPLIILATLFGMVGLVGGLIALICYLANKRSFGTPFLAIEWGSTNKIETITQNPKEGHS
ncbi:spore germination protein [Gottfriedia luciferensis]|uniref:spore germination protein n=1 Tax=Gottfriedia luciferensis TaxID=178774 RepID=UPI000B453925|nr:spore germination protein [Gottfriedia luciferensis]